MLNATLKSLFAHKLRLALTALAVVLGVMLMAGTFVLTDTIKHGINSIIGQTSAGRDAIVQGVAPFSAGARGGQDSLTGNTRPLVPETLLPTVRGVPGVAVADGQVAGIVGLLGSDGKSLGPSTGAPTVAVGWEPDRVLSSLTLRSGHAPQRAGELVVDAKTASSKKLSIGSMVTVNGNLGPQPYTVVGLVGFGTADTLAGATIVAFDTMTAQQIAGKPGYFTEIDIRAVKGTDANTLLKNIGAVLPRNYEVISAAAAVAQASESFNSFFNIFSTVLLVFGLIALFVGAFLIFNTFSILVGQRTRELALLRAVGASRGQVMASVLGEAMLVGLFGSALGIALGVGLAWGLYTILKSSLSLGSASLQFLSRTFIVSIVVGTVITLFAAVFPAMRASRVPPVAAMRDDVVIGESSLRRRAVIGGAVLAAGILVLIYGLVVNANLLPVGVGAAITFIGIAMLVPFIASPMARIIGAPLPVIQGVTGRLGRENSARNPRRTAATASALMIGIAVVAAIATLAASALASFTGIFDRSFQANYVISTGTGQPFKGPSAEAAVRGAPGVTAISGFSEIDFHSKGTSKVLGGLDPVQGPQLFHIDMVKGSSSSLADGKLLVDDATATNDHLKVGDAFPMTFAITGDKTLTIGGTFQTNQLLGHYVVENSIIAANSNTLQDAVILAKTSSQTPAEQAALTKALASFPDLKVKTGAQFKADQEKNVKVFLNIVYVLLAMSIIIAIFGVVNTLALSVFERTREIGLMRSIGMFRRQVRGMIRGEAIVVTVLGAALGLVVGIAFGAAFVAVIASGSSGFITQFALPYQTIIIVLIVALIAGVFAALFPARRASRLDVLKAITAA